MARISQGRIEKHRKLIDEDLFEIQTPEFRDFPLRASREGLASSAPASPARPPGSNDLRGDPQ